MPARTTKAAHAATGHLPPEDWQTTVLRRLDALEEQVRAVQDWIAATQAAADDFVEHCSTTGQAD